MLKPISFSITLLSSPLGTIEDVQIDSLMLSMCYEPHAKLESLQALSLVQDF